jgi:putative transposase
MAKPARNASSEAILSSERVFFATTKTSMARRILQSERNATLLIEVLRSNVGAGRFQLHDFVIMPDHLHLLMTIPSDMTIEKAMQLVKGGFSYRLRKEYGVQGEVWQRGFSEVRVNDRQSWLRYREYIGQNPVKAGLVDYAEQYPYIGREKAQGLNRLRKNSGFGEKHTSGAKAHDDYMTSMPGINPRPTLKPGFFRSLRSRALIQSKSFSASCKAHF